MALNDEIISLFDQFWEKGGVDHPGPRATADSCYRQLRNYLTAEEKMYLSIARSHAIDLHESRDEFDEVCKKVRQRLVERTQS